MDGMHAISHIYVLLFHYYLIFLAGDEVENMPVPILHLFRLSLMVVFSVFFVINGINSGRWLTRSIGSGRSLVRVSIKFIVERLAMIVAITYIFYICFALFVFFVAKELAFQRLVLDGMVANLFFVSNYVLENNAHAILWTYYVFAQLTLFTPPIMITIKL